MLIFHVRIAVGAPALCYLSLLGEDNHRECYTATRVTGRVFLVGGFGDLIVHIMSTRPDDLFSKTAMAWNTTYVASTCATNVLCTC
jgi:hypothetical protein